MNSKMTTQDWTGNRRSTWATLGASSHSEYEREERDFYATDPMAIDSLFELLGSNLCSSVWEPACGNGHLSRRMVELLPHLKVYNSDIVQRDFPCEIYDFLGDTRADRCYVDIITNPPYKYALEFVEKGLETVANGHYVCMFLKITFLEGQERKKFFAKYPPHTVAVFSKRVQVARNGDPEMFKKSSAACYAWFIWEKGFVGDPIIKWI